MMAARSPLPDGFDLSRVGAVTVNMPLRLAPGRIKIKGPNGHRNARQTPPARALAATPRPGCARWQAASKAANATDAASFNRVPPVRKRGLQFCAMVSRRSCPQQPVVRYRPAPAATAQTYSGTRGCPKRSRPTVLGSKTWRQCDHGTPALLPFHRQQWHQQMGKMGSVGVAGMVLTIMSNQWQ